MHLFISRSSVGGNGSNSWWCAPFGAGTGAVQEPDYISPQTRQQIPQWSAPVPKVSINL